MKKLLIAMVPVIALSAPTANAQLFGGLCTTALGPCASLPQQLVEFARMGEQLLQEIAIVENTLNVYINAVENTIALPFALYAEITEPIRQITALAAQADLMVNRTRGFIDNLSAGYYPLPQNGMDQLISHQNAVANSISTLGQVLNTENARLAQTSATIAALQSEALTNRGRHQTLQDQAQLQAAIAQQQQSMEAIHIARAQADHAIRLAQYDRQAMQDAWADQLSTSYTPLPTSGAPTYASVP